MIDLNTPEFTFVERLLWALFFGALIGIERQRYSHPAGLRTNTLVAMGAAIYIGSQLSANGDPSHVAGQVITGIGFLGGGVILREGLNVRGLNTAATLWCSGGVGVLAGSGLIVEAAIATLAIVFTNVAFRPLALLVTQSTVVTDQETNYLLHVYMPKKKEGRIRTLLLHEIGQNSALRLQGINSTRSEEGDNIHVTAKFFALSKNNRLMEELVARISLEEGISSASWELGS